MLALMPAAAHAQDAASTLGNTGPSEIQPTPGIEEDSGEEIVITGIRASLQAAVDLKRNGQGVVDAISAEDIGKFPDTNLAESLQRITGVSIDRSNGEGSTVTVRGFGPEYNLVTLNGRQMPTSTLGDGASPPASRSFDFANLASEGIAAVEVYKTGRAAVPSGGIGSTINIRTPRPLDRPGLRGSIAVRGVLDTSQDDDQSITPEVSGIISSTFGSDDQFGVLVTGIYQKRNARTNTGSVGFGNAFLGTENDWGTLGPEGPNVINRPGPTDVYEIPQSAAYNINNFERERINGQAVLQFRPADALTATVDFTYSRNKVEARDNSVGIWFNFGDTTTQWTDGPVAGPVFYTERFGPGKDLSYSGALTANVSENKSLGGNLTWEAPGGVTVVLDAHHSTAESKPSNNFGSSMSVGTAVFGVQSQTVDFTKELPIISYIMQPGIDALDASRINATGNSFRNAYFKDEINQVQLSGRYDHDGDFLDSIDVGFSYVENRVRSAYGFIQNDTWGGLGTPADLPDDIFELVTLPDKFKGVSGSGDGIIPAFYSFDIARLVNLLEDRFGICSRPLGGTPLGDGCLATFDTDRRITEKTISPFIQANMEFDVLGRDAHIIAGVRYDQTNVESTSLTPIPTGTAWVAVGEFNIIYGSSTDFLPNKGSYDNWLPAIDVDVEPLDGLKLRASYSHTITRADYGSLQGGLTLSRQFGIAGGGGQQGNPNLVPFLSKNIDLSAEWYYDDTSYVSAGYFRKRVSNFINSQEVERSAFDLRNPADGPRFRAAQAALGGTTDVGLIRDYILRNFTNGVEVARDAQGQPVLDQNGRYTGRIFGLAEDGLVDFRVGTPFNSDQTATIDGFEFAIQHSFWDTGFGTILNYTVVRGDTDFDNALDPNVGQFALAGLSDSANAVLYYDRGGLQARVAYNWRAEFYAGGNPNPTYVEDYGQVDASASYEFVPGLTGFVEAINLTNASRRGHRRSDNFVTFSQPGFARYSAGVRFNF
ncbi:TonB-dependent receptor [Sphingomonas jejuensis]|uniref:TonB-dependent receptor n=1 Tax=Sphingomonas jejuensis TaxID=904715 RepID=A0ABX0XI79_9SPHN|nr:TonB-dependent receptor [Sphingomonas jejuensis]NJC33043.1 TonB-dependent receptor [Sphingomonas jejuensis]